MSTENVLQTGGRAPVLAAVEHTADGVRAHAVTVVRGRLWGTAHCGCPLHALTAVPDLAWDEVVAELRCRRCAELTDPGPGGSEGPVHQYATPS